MLVDKPDIKISQLFSAPFIRLYWKGVDNLNTSLFDGIIQRSKYESSENQSNAGGWQSTKTLQNWKIEGVEQLLKMINVGVFMIMTECLGEEEADKLQNWTIGAWANINSYGNYNMIHNHCGGFWSGVYYVEPGEESKDNPNSGIITFRSPTMAAISARNLGVPEVMERIFLPDYSVKPTKGLMLIFPSWLDHFVHPYHGNRPRVSISWDTIF